ncbi:MAG: MFS transporter [Desulfomonilaceae bacterium]|nr:MFS transporter [Desulfomonilaceae bacterium]
MKSKSATNQRSGYLAVIGSSLAIFWPGAFIFGFPGVMAPYWKDMFQVGQGALGNIMFFVLAAVGTTMFFVGRRQEKVGIRVMITIGAVLCGLDVLMLAFVTNIFMIYVWAFVMGAASCFIYVPGLTTVQRWFPARRGLVTGIVNMMFALSAAILSPIFGYLLTGMGYVPMIVAMAITASAMGIAGAQWTDLPPRKERADPSDTASSIHDVLAGERALTVGQSVRTRSFWFLWVTWALQGAACISMVTLSTSYGLFRGFELESAVIILTAFNLASGVSRLVGGVLSDIMGRNSVMSLTFFAAAAAFYTLPHTSSLIPLAGLAIVIGFAFGTLFAVSAPLAVDCFGIVHFGAVFGMVFTAYGFVAGPIGPSLTGYLLDFTGGNYHAVFSYLGTCSLVSGVLIRYVRPPILTRPRRR